MGFGFNLLFIFVLVPSTIILLVLGVFTKRKESFKLLGLMWMLVLGLIVLSFSVQFFTNKKTVKEQHLYGEYIIDRSKFSGEQSDWQYNNFRFKITKDNSLILYETNGSEIEQVNQYDFEFVSSYASPRIKLETPITAHHIVIENPTLYRTTWSFYYVFESPKFGNMFFKKGKWKPI